MALKFVDPRPLNPLLGPLPPLLGATTTGGFMLPATGLTSCHGVHKHSFVSWRNPPPGKLSNQYAESRKNSPSTGNPLQGSGLPRGIQSSSGGAQLVELAQHYKLSPATAGKKAGVKEQRQNACNISTIQKITYVTLTYNTALLPSLLIIFARVRKEQHPRFFSCYTTTSSLHLSSSSGA